MSFVGSNTVQICGQTNLLASHLYEQILKYSALTSHLVNHFIIAAAAVVVVVVVVGVTVSPP
jgi:large-conductance mechanosensitive channel